MCRCVTQSSLRPRSLTYTYIVAAAAATEQANNKVRARAPLICIIYMHTNINMSGVRRLVFCIRFSLLLFVLVLVVAI